MKYVLLQVACAALLMVQWRLAARFGGATRLLVRLQAIFWAVAYVARPLFVVLDQPNLRNPLADRRLIISGYQAGMADLLAWIVLGLTSSVVTYFVLSKIAADRRSRSPNLSVLNATRNQDLWPVLLVMFIGGWVGRLSDISLNVAILSVLSPMATVAVCLAIVVYKPHGSRFRLLLIAALVSEGTWTVLFTSKTPLLALLTALAIRWSGELTPRQFGRRMPVVAVVGIAVFLAVQPLKGIDTASSTREYADSDTSVAFGAIVSVLERIDLVSAVADANYFPGDQWLSLKEYSQQLFFGSIPKANLTNFEGVGIRWTREVRARSIPNQFTDVYLATGPIAEGIVQGGPLGVLLESSAIAVLTIAVGAGLASRRPTLMAVASLYAFDTGLYERGILGEGEVFSRAIQLVVVVGVCSLIFKPSRSRNSVDQQIVSEQDEGTPPK